MTHSKKSIKKRILTASALVLLLMVGGYIVQINTLTTTAYAITTAEKELKQLLQEQRTLEATKASTLSFSEMASLAHTLEFEKVSNVSYIQVSSTSVARLPDF